MPSKDPYTVIRHATVTEKTMNMIYDELETRSGVVNKGNKIVLMVTPKSTKKDIKWAVEKLFQVKVAKVNTHYTKHGKQAFVTLTDDYSAEEVGSRIGVF